MPSLLQTGLDLVLEGLRRGHRVPRPLQPRALELLDADLAPEGITAKIKARLAPTIVGADAAVLDDQRERARAFLDDGLLPALRRVRDAIANLDSDLTDEIGLSAQPGGRDYYRYKVRQQTSTDVDPDAIHAIGLSEIARISTALEGVLARMGRPGEQAAVAAELEARVAPDADTLLNFVRAYAKRVDGLIPRPVRPTPRVTYGIEQFTAAASAAMPPAIAQRRPPIARCRASIGLPRCLSGRHFTCCRR
jgi:uncharacterized protein (DUF885 family)